VWGQKLGQLEEALYKNVSEEVVKKRQLIAGIATCALACALMVLGGCTSSESYTPQLKDATVSTPTIGEDGTLRVGVNTENPPLAGTGNGKIIGLDVDIAAALADEMGLKVSIVDVGTDPATALANNQVDIVLGIDDSSTEGDFWVSSSYLPTGIAVFALSADAGIPTEGSDATFAAQASSKSAWAVSNDFGESSLTSTDSLKEAFEMLQEGTVKYVAADAIIGLYAAHGQGIDASIVAMMMKPTGYAMGVSSSNTDLQTAASNALTTLSDQGIIDVIEKKWLGQAISLDSLSIVGDDTASAVTTDSSSSTDSSDSSTDSSSSTDSDA
jgi:polar amino acid transport system substrate-binding protein